MLIVLPTILAIDASTEYASVALLTGERLFVRACEGAQSHSMTVLPMVREVLDDAGLALADCNALAFGAGPGAFTGVRTACGIVQGLAFGASLPVMPQVTLLAMAESARAAGAGDSIVAVLDARMGEVYWAHYRFEGDWQTVHAPALGRPEDVIAGSSDALCGNGLLAYAESFASLPVVATLPEVLPQASAMVQLARRQFSSAGLLPARDAQPLYLRNKVALTTREREAGALA